MIEIYSSYYSRIKSLDTESILLVQVSQTLPEWFSGEIVNVGKLVAPNWSLINRYKGGQISYAEFSEQYRHQLDSTVDKKKILNEILLLAEERNCQYVVLLCWEKDMEECHRKVLGEWLTDEFRYEL